MNSLWDLRGIPNTEQFHEGQISPEYDTDRGVWVEEEIIRRTEIGANEGGHANFADAEFITASRTAMPALIAEVRRLRKEK